MAKPLDEFGGWLFFYWLTSIISMIILGVVVLLAILAITASAVEGKNKQVIEFAVLTLDLTVTFILFIFIIRLIKIQEKETPAKIRKLLLIMLTCTIVFLAIEIPVTYWARAGELLKDDFDTFRGSIQSIVYCVIWMSYFKNSERVALFYGLKTKQESDAAPIANTNDQ